MAKQGIVTPYDDAGFPAAAAFVANWTAAASGVAIKTSAGRLCRVVILTAFTGTTTNVALYDNAAGTATGTPLLSLAVGSALNTGGQVLALDLPVVNGISIVGSGGSFTGGVIGIGYS
jgi:hypothetical protein